MAGHLLLASEHALPGGTLVVVRDPLSRGDREHWEGAVVATSFRGFDDAVERLPGAGGVIEREGTDTPLGEVLARYAEGDLRALEEVGVAQPGGPFRERAWAAMRGIAAGTVITYAELAERAGSPRAFRAAGTACAVNAAAPFVPCHRVVASSGLGGYGYGLAVKRSLLAHEGLDLGSWPVSVTRHPAL